MLVQTRKSSRYVRDQLVPALRKAGLSVEVQTGWVEDLVGLFNRSTVYLYDSAEYWRGRGVSEGFGLPPLEAMACGCVVFSSLNHALADHAEPGWNLHQIGCGRLAFDVRRIQAAVAAPAAWRPKAGGSEAAVGEVFRTVSAEAMVGGTGPDGCHPCLRGGLAPDISKLEIASGSMASASSASGQSVSRLAEVLELRGCDCPYGSEGKVSLNDRSLN